MRCSVPALACAALLAACASPGPVHPVARAPAPSPVQSPYPAQTSPRPQPRPLQDASRQIGLVQQLLSQLQALGRSLDGF